MLLSGNLHEDVKAINAFASKYETICGMRCLHSDSVQFAKMFWGMTEQLGDPGTDGFFKASPFKQVASFTINFLNHKPLKVSFPDTFNDLARYPHALFAVQYSIAALHNASIQKPDESFHSLTVKIEPSYHYVRDFIEWLETSEKPLDCFVPTFLVYEALAYQFNPTVAYPVKL